MTSLASLLPDERSVTAVLAIADTCMETAALILEEFQSGFFVSAELMQPSKRLEGCAQTQGIKGSVRVDGHRQGRLV